MSADPQPNDPKPPLGLMPQHIWQEKRMLEIMRACIRYSDSNMAVPGEWLDELAELYYRKKSRP